MKEEKDLYLYEDDVVKFCFTKRTLDGKNILELKKVLSKYNFSIEKLSYAKQVHGNKVEIVGSDMLEFSTECDALITDKAKMPLLIFTADCVPLIFYDNVKKVASLAHAGWKGTYANIGGEVVSKMQKKYNCSLEDIKVFIGPHISVDNYQVSFDLIEKFSRFKIENYYKKVEGSYFLDLEVINKHFLKEAGILENNINVSEFCTVRNNDKFFSYRKDECTQKRIATLIELNI